MRLSRVQGIQWELDLDSLVDLSGNTLDKYNHGAGAQGNIHCIRKNKFYVLDGG